MKTISKIYLLAIFCSSTFCFGSPNFIGKWTGIPVDENWVVDPSMETFRFAVNLKDSNLNVEKRTYKMKGATGSDSLVTCSLLDGWDCSIKEGAIWLSNLISIGEFTNDTLHIRAPLNGGGFVQFDIEKRGEDWTLFENVSNSFVYRSILTGPE